ncbi:MAG TPA: hypothetical protein VFP50_10325 [Anaeromyxobacteraceae bacterium]|nr:hypothetical protein [Anaeromyxobacteraceae bacterium]
MTRLGRLALRILLPAVGLTLASTASAIPAFARKYATSCLTCHTVYPKLTPFGEAFRANGYRFPGVDSDLVKAEQVVLAQEANKKTFPNSVWPASIPAAVPLAIGANGTARLFPSSRSSAGVAASGARFTTQDLVGEAHLWAGAALDDSTTLWGELTFADGGAEVEHAQILFNDLLGPKHALNVIVGHGFPNVTQYGPHSSYLADVLLPTVPVTDLYGLTSGAAWSLTGNYTGVEANGVLADGRLDWALGVNAGPTDRISSSDNVYGRIGLKVGGMRLDGEGSTGAADALHPWAEDAIGVYAFAYRSDARFTVGTDLHSDVAPAYGVGARLQSGSAELNAAYYTERHGAATDAFGKVNADVWFAELSYVLFPWMVPALRVEGVTLKPSGGDSVSDLHLMPGLAFAIRPNVKLVAVANFELSHGFPSVGGAPVAWQGGAADWGPLQIAPSSTDPARKNLSEVETIAFFLAWAM